MNFSLSDYCEQPELLVLKAVRGGVSHHPNLLLYNGESDEHEYLQCNFSLSTREIYSGKVEMETMRASYPYRSGSRTHLLRHHVSIRDFTITGT